MSALIALSSHPVSHVFDDCNSFVKIYMRLILTATEFPAHARVIEQGLGQMDLVLHAMRTLKDIKLGRMVTKFRGKPFCKEVFFHPVCHVTLLNDKYLQLLVAELGLDVNNIIRHWYTQDIKLARQDLDRLHTLNEMLSELELNNKIDQGFRENNVNIDMGYYCIANRDVYFQIVHNLSEKVVACIKHVVFIEQTTIIVEEVPTSLFSRDCILKAMTTLQDLGFGYFHNHFTFIKASHKVIYQNVSINLAMRLLEINRGRYLQLVIRTEINELYDSISKPFVTKTRATQSDEFNLQLIFGEMTI